MSDNDEQRRKRPDEPADGGAEGAGGAAGDRPAPVRGGDAAAGEEPPHRRGTALGGERRTDAGAATSGDEATTAGTAGSAGGGAATAGEQSGAEPVGSHPLPGPRRAWEDADLPPLPRRRPPATEEAPGERRAQEIGPGDGPGARPGGGGPGEAAGADRPGGDPPPRPEDTGADPRLSRPPQTPAIAPATAAAEPRESTRRSAATEGGEELAAPGPAAAATDGGETATSPVAERTAEREDATAAWPRPRREGSTPPPSPPPAAGGEHTGAAPASPGAPSPHHSPLPSPRPRPPAAADAEPPPPRPEPPPPPPPAPERPSGPAQPAEPSPPPATAEPATAEPPSPATAEPPAADLDELFADLASGARERDADEEERSYRELVRQVDSYREQGYDFYGLVGYPAAGKTHALKALAQRLHGFDAAAREHFRRERAPVPTEAWPFYYAHTGSQGERWVFMDPGGELYYRLRSNDWRLAEASAGLLHTIGHCRGLFLLLHLTRGHLGLGATGFARGMDEEERQREAEAQKAQEEIEFFDQFLLFARALAAERGDVAKLVRRASDAGLDEALRPYHRSPRLEAPVAVLFTQADRLAGGMDFAGVEGSYAAPQSEHFRTAPFVARNLPTLLTTLLRHARRFRFDFVQSYVEKPAAGEGLPLWAVRNEPLSVGLVPALEYLLRRSPAGGGRGLGRLAIDARTALRLHRLLHPRLWDGIEVDL